MPSFEELVTAEQAGNDPVGTPDAAETETTDTEKTEPAGTTGNDSPKLTTGKVPGAGEESVSPAGDPSPPDPAVNIDEYVERFSQDPKAALEAYAKAKEAQFERGVTPKLQEAAQIRKTVDGIDPEDLTTLSQVYRLMKSDPGQAADWFDSLSGRLRQSAEPDPLATYIPQTETEAVLLEQVKALKEQFGSVDRWKSQQEERTQQAELNARRESVLAEFAAAEKLGIRYSHDDQAKVWHWADQKGLTVEQAIWALNHSTMSPALQETARQEGNSRLQTKVAHSSANPASIVDRTSEAPPEPTSFEEMTRLEMQKLGIS